MAGLPTGTVTFVFTDIEGSTQLWEQYPNVMPTALQQHDTLLREGVEKNRGYVFKTVGDAFCATFSQADDALKAVLDIQHALQTASWEETGPLRVRMALHTGTAEERDNDYFGPAVNRVARLLSTGHGGQILLSLATYELINDKLPQDVVLRDLGDHRLKDLVRSERIYQVEAPHLVSSFPALKSLDQFVHNLPIQTTRFIGREKELAQVKALFQVERLITLTGPGGTGKTRLSLQVAAELLEDYEGGVWYVALSPLTDPTRVVSTVAAVLGVQEQTSRSLQDVLIGFLHAKRVLLILDNCEHLVEACAHLTEALLRNCKDVNLLATSREALHIGGEYLWSVPPLRCPETAESIASLNQYEAVQLFVDRAKLVRPHFALTQENASAVVRLCIRLDGIPLALELAAVRIKMMSVAQICLRLDDRFRLLTGGSRTAERRQQTLAAAIDWSYALLDETEQKLFCRLSVFRGGWTLDAVEAVAVGEDIAPEDVLDGLISLVDKSLVFVLDSEMDVRYGMQETIREYGRHKQIVSPEIEKKYTTYYLEIARELNRRLDGPEQNAALHQMALELDNFREAQKIVQGQGNNKLLGTWGTVLIHFYELRGLWSEGLEFLTLAEAALASLPPHSEWVKLQLGLGRLHWRRNVYDLAQKWNTAALKQAQILNDQAGIAEAFMNLGNLAYNQGSLIEVRRYFTDSLHLFRELNDQVGIARALHSLGVIAFEKGDYIEAENQLVEGLQCFRDLKSNLGIARALHMLGVVAHGRGEYETAQNQLTEGLQYFRGLKNKLGIARALNVLGRVAYDQSFFGEAQSQFAEGLSIFRELGDKLGIAATLHGLADLAIDDASYVKAQHLLIECLQISRELGSEQTLAYTLYRWARWAVAQDFLEHYAVLLLMAVERLDTITNKEAQNIKAEFDILQEARGVPWIKDLQQKIRDKSVDEVIEQLPLSHI
jgi:predicted ATPase/class 3 adenylate cyclase